MKGLMIFGLVLVMVVLAVASVSAAGTVPNDIPATAAVIDGLPHEIAANSSLWYMFPYSVSHSEGLTQGDPVMLRLMDGTKSGVKFDVYTPAQIAKWWDKDPIGRGTPQQMHDENGPTVSSDLYWVGRFFDGGNYFVRVTNTNPFATTFTLTAEGSDVF